MAEKAATGKQRHLNSLDIIILVILVGFGGFSLIRGFVREAFALGGIILGVFAANVFYDNLGEFLFNHVKSEDIANVLAYVIIFIGTAIVMALLGRILQKSIKLSLLKWPDRLLGFILGVAKGLIVVSILVMVLGKVLSQQSVFLTNSQLKPYVESIYTFVPDSLQQKFQDKKEEVQKFIQKKKEAKSK